MKKIKLKSAYMTRIGKLDLDYIDIIGQAARAVLSRTDPGRISDVYFSSFAPGELCGVTEPCRVVADRLRADFPDFGAKIHGPFMTGGEAFYTALNENQPPRQNILLLAGEKMTHLGAGAASLLLSNRVNPHDRRYGASLPSLGALVSRSYMSTYRVPYRSFHAVAVKNHRNALLNPRAHFHKSIDEATVAVSPMVSEPLRRLHCAPTSDGAAAALLGPDGGDVTVEGWARGLDTVLFHERESISRFRATRAASLAAFEQSGTRPADMDIVEIHDAFSPFELMNLEEMGFFAHGQAWRALDNGELEIGGRWAVNPSGGMKARGHPIGICGLSSVIEGFEQLTHAAGERQHPGARLAVIQSAGGVSRESYIFVLGAA